MVWQSPQQAIFEDWYCAWHEICLKESYILPHKTRKWSKRKKRQQWWYTEGEMREKWQRWEGRIGWSAKSIHGPKGFKISMLLSSNKNPAIIFKEWGQRNKLQRIKNEDYKTESGIKPNGGICLMCHKAYIYIHLFVIPKMWFEKKCG